MGMFNGGERYAQLQLIGEGLEPKNRRMHEMTIQDRHGKVHYLKGDQLPFFISINTGKSHADKHVAEILLDKKNYLSPGIAARSSWPAGRDILNLALGFIFFWMLHRVLEVLAQASY